jgi:DNA invertase Pin-like site-specific DNA recombinase
MKIGYARVSSKDQNPERQLEALKFAGCEKIFSDRLSGAEKERPALSDMLNFIREGDILIVASIDRLGRSTIDLLEIIRMIRKKGATVEFLKEKIDLATSMGKFFFTTLSALAELERDYIRERQAEGIRIAKAKNVYRGRKPLQKPAEWDSLAADLVAGIISGYEMRKRLGVSIATYYKMRRQYGPEITGNIPQLK